MGSVVLHRDHAVGPESRIGRLNRPERAHQQPARHQQHDRHADLRGHEHRSEALPPAAAAAGPSRSPARSAELPARSTGSRPKAMPGQAPSAPRRRAAPAGPPRLAGRGKPGGTSRASSGTIAAAIATPSAPPHGREHQALGAELADQPFPPRAHRRPHRQLAAAVRAHAPAAGSPGWPHAMSRTHSGGGGKRHQQQSALAATARRAGRRRRRPCVRRLSGTRASSCAATTSSPPRRAIDRHARLQSSDDLEVVVVAVDEVRCHAAAAARQKSSARLGNWNSGGITPMTTHARSSRRIVRPARAASPPRRVVPETVAQHDAPSARRHCHRRR